MKPPPTNTPPSSQASRPRPLIGTHGDQAVSQLEKSLATTSDAVSGYSAATPKQTQELKGHIEAMAKIIGGLSAKINAVDRGNKKNYYIPEAKNPLFSAAFLIPAFLLTAVIILAIWLFSLAGLLNADALYILTIVVALLLVLQVLVSNLRNFQLRRRIAKQSSFAIREEMQLEHARAEFFRAATDELQGHLFAITSVIPQGSDAAVDEAAQKLLSLLDRMSLISTLTNRGADYVLNTESVDVPKLLKEVIASYKKQASEAHVDVRLLSPEQLVYELDPLLLKQAITPVLDNAIKFSAATKSGGRVLVTLRALHRGFELRVQDNGPGISLERRSQLFKPFSRGEDALRFNYEGAGLGLYLTSLATGLLGATVEIGHPKTGTEFIWKFQSLIPTTETESPKAGPAPKPSKLEVSTP